MNNIARGTLPLWETAGRTHHLIFKGERIKIEKSPSPQKNSN